MSDEPCELLPWDTEFFGITIARVKPARLNDEIARSVNEWCRDHRVRCLYYAHAAEDALACANVLRRENFEFMDVKLTLERVGDAPPQKLRAATAADLPALEAIAGACHRGGRFERDSRFPQERAIELYRTWISTAMEKQHVIVADFAGKVAGYSACKVAEEDGVIWLLGVDAAARGHGVGSQLVNASLAYFAAKGNQRVRVVTQAWNLPAQRLYQRCGFVTSRCEFTYHKWF